MAKLREMSGKAETDGSVREMVAKLREMLSKEKEMDD